MPALDGLRGLALAAVLAFHAGFGWASGGFLGVSTFFTLSGYLITGLLLREHDRSPTATVDLRAFWSRRLRRLLPAALLTLGAVALLAPTAPDGRLRGDVLAALAQVVNWRFLASHSSYAALFSSPSPVLHFWSLAIEAQFYVVFPLVVVAVGLLTRTRTPTRFRLVLGVVAGVVAVAGTVAAVAAGTDAAYYSTLARAPELLAGGVLALLPRPRRGTVGGALGGGALVGLLVAWSLVGVGSPALAEGGFALHALASAVVVAAAASGRGPVARLLSQRPLPELGRISYAAYLFHWPIFVWWSPWGLRGTALVAARVGLTLVLATLSTLLVELPIRRRRVALPPALTGGVAVAGTLAVALLAVVLLPSPANGGAPAFRTGVAAAGLDLSGPSPPGLPRVAVFGDSTALRTAFGLPLWGIQTRRLAFVGDETVLGCGLTEAGTMNATGTVQPIRDECRGWPDRWRARVRALDVDVALVQVGPWDTADHRAPGGGPWRHLGQPGYDAVVRDEIRTAVDALSSSGAFVLWMTSPQVAMAGPSAEPGRMDRLNALVAEVAAERPATLRIVDVAGHLATMGPDVRPDGIHVSEAASHDLAEWLGPRILDAVAPSGTTR